MVRSADPARHGHAALTGFRLGRSTTKALAAGESHRFPLVEDEVAVVLVDHLLDEEKRVGLTVKPPQAGDISYSTVCGKFFPILTRCQTKDGDRLIVAVMAK